MGIANSDKDLEIILLRQQVRILQRKLNTSPRISRPEKLLLVTLSARFNQLENYARQQMQQVMLIFKPDTILQWHRELVRRKWTFHQKRKPGRSRLSSELEELIIRLANFNSLVTILEERQYKGYLTAELAYHYIFEPDQAVGETIDFMRRSIGQE